MSSTSSSTRFLLLVACATMCVGGVATRDAVAQAAPGIVVPTLPVDPSADKTYPIRIDDANRGIRLTVYNAARVGEYGTHKAPAGRALLVINTEWENIIPLTYIVQQKSEVPTMYKIPNLGDHLYLILDGRRVVRLDPESGQLPGHVPTKDFTLERIGSRLRGNVVFEVVAAGPVGAAELRFYDFAHGHVVVPMYAEADKPAEAKPLAPAQKNEVVEAAVFGVERKPGWNGAKAPDGMTYVAADLRARSMFTYPGDATAFDPKAKPGAVMQIGTVADWTDSRKYLQLVVDGQYAYMPLANGTTLPEAPRFLPDVMTGGHVVFLAPADAKSLELRCDFPNAKKPDGQVIRPKGLTLAIEGKRPAIEQPKAIAAIDDDVYKVAVTDQRAADTFGGAKAPEGKKFLVLRVSVHNAGQQGELFQTKEQLKCSTSDGGQLQVDPATFEGKHRPSELVFIPPGERRTFEVAYAIPASEAKPRLAYGGISLAKVLDLPPLDGAVAAAPAPAAPQPVAPQPAVPQPAAPVAAAPGATPPAAPAQPAPDKPAADKAAPEKTQVAVATPTKVEPKLQPKPAKPAAPRRSNELDVLRVPAKQPHEPKGLAGVGLTAEKVNASIDRGAAFLWTYIKEHDLTSNYAFGYRKEHMLAALALVHADAHEKFPDFDAAVRRHIATYDPLRSNHTYEIGLYCMLIQSYGDPTFLPQLRTAAQWLVDTQGPEGTWGYGVAMRSASAEAPLRRVLHVAGGHPVGQPAGGEPIVRKTPWEKGADGDNSVTQYALLGLHAASRCEIKIPRETWERTLKTHRARQDKTCGGFGYTSSGENHNYGSMTCAGVCAVALARHELGEKDPAADPDVEEGLAWLRQFFTVEGNPHPAWKIPDALGTEWHYYYLYSLERVGRILGTEFIGEHEWYPLGAKHLLAAQRSADGGWLSKSDRDDPVLSTAFALLFLTRATESLDLPKRSGPGTLKTQVVVPAGQKVYLILDCSGTMMEEVAGRPRFEIAREALVKLVGDMPRNAQVALRAFGHSKSAVQPGADEDTELIVSMGVPDPTKTLAKLQALRPRGKTPLARTLLAAASDLRSAAGDKERPITVLLVTDGGDDNTKPPKTPLEAAAALAKLPNLRLYVVGFDVQRADWVEQLTGLARSGGGQYLAAADEAALHREMKTAVLGLPESFSVTDAEGKPAGGGAFGESKPLPEGKYTFRTTFAGKTFEQPFWINAGATTAITFDAAMVAKEEAAATASPAAPQPPQSPASPPAAADAAPAPAPAPAAAGKKFCTNCGTKIAAGTKFCTNCGVKQ